MVYGQNYQAVNTLKKTKREEPTAEFSTNPVKFGKAILKWDAESFKSHQQAYELIPQEKKHKRINHFLSLFYIMVNPFKALKWV